MGHKGHSYEQGRQGLNDVANGSWMLQGVVETKARGNVKNIAVSMEDRMGGRKHLTHLSHVESFGLDPDELATVLQRKWSTSCSISRLPGKTETGKMLDLQGNLLKVLRHYALHLAVLTLGFIYCLGWRNLSHRHATLRPQRKAWPARTCVLQDPQCHL